MTLRGWASKVVVAVIIVILGAACTQMVGGENPNQPCSPGARYSSQYGLIAIQQAGPGAPLQWGLYPHVPASRYVVDVFVGKNRVDHKDQNYPPHGSINAKDLYTGAQVAVTG